MILWVVIVLTFLFVIAPLTASVPNLASAGWPRRRSAWVLGSTCLRSLIAAGVLWLYSGGGLQDRVTQTTPPVQVTALVDTSTSMVSRSANVAAYGQAAAERIQEVLDALDVSSSSVQVVLFDESVRRLDGGLAALESLSASDLTVPRQNITRLRQALASVPASTPDAAYTILLTDGWIEGGSEAGTIGADLLRAVTSLGQPIISVPLNPSETWRYANPDQPRLITQPQLSPERYVAGGDSERTLMFALGPPSMAQRARSADLALSIQGRDELISQYACRDTEAKGVGRLTLPKTNQRLLPCLPLTTLADPAGAAAQSVLGLGADLAAAKQAVQGDGRGPTPDQAVVTFLERGYVPRVLVLDGGLNEVVVPSIVASSLANLGWRWDRVDPQAWIDKAHAGEPVDLDAYDAVMMLDIAPGRFGVAPSDWTAAWGEAQSRRAIRQTLDQISEYVAGGGGLFLSGGAESFGVGGYASTAIEPLLPVQLDPKGAAGDPPIVVVAVLDVSASLWYAEDTFDRAVTYLLNSFENLPDGSQVRVLGYSDEPHELVPLQPYVGQEALRRLLTEALDALGEEFERRRLLGLQPEGLDVFGALFAGYRTFDRFDRQRQDQAFRDASAQRGAALFATENEPERRLFLIMDAADRDLLTFNRWTIDATGTFVRMTAADLVQQRFAEGGVVLNSIGMTYGDTPLPPDEVIAGSDNSEWRDRLAQGHVIAQELEQLSAVGGGASYLDQFEIPLGSLSRRMTDYVDDSVTVEPNLNHRFLPSSLIEQFPQTSLSGAAIAPSKANARTILNSDYQPESGPPVRLGVWTEWVTQSQNIQNIARARRPDLPELESEETSDDSAIAQFVSQDFAESKAQLSYGGAVSVLTSSLRDASAEAVGFSDTPLHQVAFVRMLDWLVRTSPRDQFQFTAHLVPGERSVADGQSIQTQLSIQSTDALALNKVEARLWKLEETALRSVPAEELASDGLPIDLTNVAQEGEKLLTQQRSVPLKSPRQSRSIVTAQINQDAWRASLNKSGAVLLDFQIFGLDRSGRQRQVDYRLFVRPDQLQTKIEPASWIRGSNEALMRELAAFSGGAHFSPEMAVELTAAPAPVPIETSSRMDFRWIIVLLMIAAFIADFVIREYRIGRG